jgi:hypothetical protein
VPGTQLPGAVVDGAQFMVPKGAGVTAGVVAFAGVVVSLPGCGGVVEGVTTLGGVVAVFGTLAGGGGVTTGAAALPAAAVCAPAATAESIVHATAKHAITKNAPEWRLTECGFFMCLVLVAGARLIARPTEKTWRSARGFLSFR